MLQTAQTNHSLYNELTIIFDPKSDKKKASLQNKMFFALAKQKKIVSHRVFSVSVERCLKVNGVCQDLRIYVEFALIVEFAFCSPKIMTANLLNEISQILCLDRCHLREETLVAILSKAVK